MGAGESETGRSVFEVTPARSLAGQSVSVALEEAFCPSLFVKHQNTDTDARAPRDTFSKFDQTLQSFQPNLSALAFFHNHAGRYPNPRIPRALGAFRLSQA